MNKTIFFLILSVLLISNVSADNVTFDIFYNSIGDFYVSYDGSDLIPCDGDSCTFDVDEYSSNVTDYDLSNRDITKIAQRVAIEIDFAGDSVNYGVNESFIVSVLSDVREDTTDNLRSYIMNTIVPSVEEIDEYKNKLSDAEIRIVELESKEREYDTMVETKDVAIDTLERENDRMHFITIMAMIGFIFIIITCTDAGKEALQYIGKFRRR